METSELIFLLDHEYYAIAGANPEWDKSIVRFLLEKGIDPGIVYAYHPQEAEEEGIEKPEWY